MVHIEIGSVCYIHSIGLGFAGIRELLGGNDQPDELVLLDKLVLVLTLLLQMSKKCLDGLSSLFM